MTDVYVPPSNTTLPALSTPITVTTDSDLVALTITYSPSKPSEVVWRRGQFLYPFLHSTRSGNTFTVVRNDGWPADFEVFPDEVEGVSVSIDGPFVLAAADSDIPGGRVLQAGTNITVTDGGPGGAITISATYATILPGGAPVNVTRSAAAAGTSANYARADHKHDITTDVPVSVGVANAEGTSTALARADHVHASPASTSLTAVTPQSVGTSNIVGTGTAAAREDHVHKHDDQPGGTLHAIVTTTIPGFMSAADKIKLDGVTPGAGSGVALTTVAPQAISTIAAVGTGTAAAREDHIHAHANQPGGSLHALVTTTVHGFMAYADKVKLDLLGTSMFLNVLDVGVVRGALANNTLRSANRAAFIAADAQARSQNLILAIPAGDYEIYGGALTATSGSRWLGKTNSQIIQYGTGTGLDCPVVHCGAALGSSADTSGILIDGLSLRYAGAGIAGAHALELTGVWRSYFANIDIGDVNAAYAGRTSVPWAGVYWDPTPGTVPPFSNVFMNVTCKMFGWRGLSMTRNDDGATGQSTGNVWINTYLSGGENVGTGNRQDLSAVSGSGMVVASGHTQLRFIQLNTEWCATDNMFGANAVHELEINGWNIEGIELKQASAYKCGWIRPYNTRMKVSGLTLYNSTALASNNVTAGSLFLCGPNTRVSFDTIHADRIVRTGGSTAVFDSKDGPGDDDVHIDAGMLYLNAPNAAFDRYSAFQFATAGSGSLFGPLMDFHNSTVVVLGDTSETLYAYNTPGIYACAPTVSRTKTVARKFSALENCIIAPGATKEFRKYGGSGDMVIANYDGTVLCTMSAVGVVRIVFDGSNWNLLSATVDSTSAGAGSLTLATVTPAAVNAGTGTVGIGTTAARDDHRHQVATATPVSIGTSNSAGTATTLARSDHVHDGTTILSAFAPLDINNANYIGTSTRAAREDHTHAGAIRTLSYLTIANEVTNLPSSRRITAGVGTSVTDGGAGGALAINANIVAGTGIAVTDLGGGAGLSISTTSGSGVALSSTTPAAEVVGSGAVGTGTTAARSDHVHPMSAGTPVATGTANSAGSAITVARSDHVHLAPPLGASYIVMANDATLTAERALAVTQGISLQDLGGNSSVFLSQTTIDGSNRAHTLKGWPGFPGMSGSTLANELQANGPFVRQFHTTGSADPPFDSRPWWIELTDSFWGTSEVVGVTSIAVRCQGAAGHAALPATMPSFSLRSYAGSTGVESIAASATDSSASVSAYQTAHSITWSGSPIALSRGGRWFIRIEGERGTNSVVGLQFYGLFLSCSYY